jgi:hypothetical protein
MSRPMSMSNGTTAFAKLWLDPVRLERSGGFARRELSEIDRIVRDNETDLLDAWHDYFST